MLNDHNLTKRNSGKLANGSVFSRTMDKNESEIPFEIEMEQVNERYPGARRALFAKYHIGGCSSCSYEPGETLQSVCERNEIDFSEARDFILKSHTVDQEMLISPEEVDRLIKSGENVLLIDTRTREEHEAVKISGSELMTQEYQQKVFASVDPAATIVLYDHIGSSVLDTCAWFIGHNMLNTKGMEGGIDAWSKKVDKSVARYRMEMS